MRRRSARLTAKLAHTIGNLWIGDLNTSMNVELKQKENLFHDFCCWFDVYSHSRILCTIPEMQRKCARPTAELGHTIANRWRGDLNTSMNVELKQKTGESEDLRRGFSNLRRKCPSEIWFTMSLVCLHRSKWNWCSLSEFESKNVWKQFVSDELWTPWGYTFTKCVGNGSAIWFQNSTWKSLWQFWSFQIIFCVSERNRWFETSRSILDYWNC